MTLVAESDEAIYDILEKIKQRGTDLGHFKISFLKRRIDSRMRICKITSYLEYANLIETDEQEYLSILQNLSINVTDFFRDFPVFAIFQDEVLPKICEKNPSGTINLWSAGCATGQETYSLAMICSDLTEKFPNCKFKIHATDRSVQATSFAKSGIYSKLDVQNLPLTFKEKYFTMHSDDTYEIKDGLKNMISFSNGDLTKPSLFKNLDVVFCRNVIIYLDKSARQNIFENFYNSLSSQGYMIIGQSEVLETSCSNLFKSIHPRERVYMKK